MAPEAVRATPGAAALPRWQPRARTTTRKCARTSRATMATPSPAAPESRTSGRSVPANACTTTCRPLDLACYVPQAVCHDAGRRAGGTRTRQRRAIVCQSLSGGLATGAYGISFGALSVASGLDIWQTVVLSLLLFSGARSSPDARPARPRGRRGGRLGLGGRGRRPAAGSSRESRQRTESRDARLAGDNFGAADDEHLEVRVDDLESSSDEGEGVLLDYGEFARVPVVVATSHPSSVLRSRSREVDMIALVAALRAAASLTT